MFKLITPLILICVLSWCMAAIFEHFACEILAGIWCSFVWIGLVAIWTWCIHGSMCFAECLLEPCFLEVPHFSWSTWWRPSCSQRWRPWTLHPSCPLLFLFSLTLFPVLAGLYSSIRQLTLSAFNSRYLGFFLEILIV